MGCACKSKQAKHGLLYNYTYVVLPWTKKRLHAVVVCFQPPCHGRGLEAERKRQIKLTPRSVSLSTTWRRLGRDDGFNKPKKITAFSNAMEEVHREAKKTNQTKHNLDITNKLGISGLRYNQQTRHISLSVMPWEHAWREAPTQRQSHSNWSNHAWTALPMP